MSYVKGDTSHVQGTLQGPWCVFMLPNISLCVGLLNGSPIPRRIPGEPARNADRLSVCSILFTASSVFRIELQFFFVRWPPDL